MNEQNLVGSVINERYELLENIGSGGMALVYKANDRLLNRTVAIKILKDSLKNDTEVIEKFSAEGRASASLSHNNIVAVYDVGTIDDLSFIVMEYVDGITLKEYINNNKPINWKEAAEITIQIATALKVAHEHGIVHRDVKPHNILITKDNIAKVTDFGIASAVGSDTVVAGGSAMGSVHYISPEQARGGYVDNTSDIYSLGVVLYEMLTGVLPFDGDNAVSIALMKLEQEPVNPKVINLDIPQELDAVVMKAISKEQHIRYKTAEEFSDDLKNLINGDRARVEEISARLERETIENERKRPEKNNNRKIGFNPIIASVVLFLIIVLSVYSVMNYGGKEYTVPDLVGLSVDEAIKTAEDKGFTIEAEDIEYEKSEIVEAGRVIFQTPLGDKKVKRDKTIDLVVSLGLADGEIKVPDLRNRQITQAIELLEDKGLGYEVKYEETDDFDDGHVIKQSPEGDSMVNEGFKVIVYVAKEVEKEPEESEEPVESTQPEESENSEPTETSEPVQTPEQTPVQTPSQTTETNTLKTKTLSIILPDRYGDSIQVKVYANGKEIYNKNHQKSEGKIDIPVKSSKDAEVQVYMNEDLVVHKIIKFD